MGRGPVIDQPALIDALPAGASLCHVPLLQWAPELAHIPLARWIAGGLGDSEPALTTNSFLAMREAARVGLGAMLAPRFQARRAGLRVVPVPTPPLPEGGTYLVVPRPLRQIPRIAAVVDQLVEDVEALVATERALTDP